MYNVISKKVKWLKLSSDLIKKSIKYCFRSEDSIERCGTNVCDDYLVLNNSEMKLVLIYLIMIVGF